jgi:hypothetical protein
MKRALVVGAIVAALVVVSTIAVLFGRPGRTTKVTEPTAPTAESSPGQTPVATESLSPEEAQEEARERQIAAYVGQPILKALPHRNDFWSLEYVGSENGVYRLSAIVYYTPGTDDPQQKIEQQKPHILGFIRNTRQPEGTYSVTYRAATVGETTE